MARDDPRRDPTPDRLGWCPPLDALHPVAAGRIRDRVRALATGDGGVLVVHGDHDAGTAWYAAAARNQHDGPTRRGRASPARRRVPLWPLWEAVGDEDAGPRGRGGADAISHVVTLLTDLADRAPLLVVIEELEHADPWTLAGIEALADATVGHPLLLVVTLSSTGLSAADQLVDSLHERDQARRVAVGPVATRALADLVAGLLDGHEPPDELLAFVEDRSAGLPRLAERIVRTAVRRGVLAEHHGRWRVVGDLERALPDDTRSGAFRALAAASTMERDVLTAVAVLGAPTTVRVLADAVGCDVDTVANAVASAAERGLLTLGESVGMRTGIVRDCVLQTLAVRTPLETLERLADIATHQGDTTGFDRVLAVLQGTEHAGAVPDLRLRMAQRAVADGDLAGARRQLDAVPNDNGWRTRVARLALEVGALTGAQRDDTERALAALGTEADAGARQAAAGAVAFRDLDAAAELLGDAPTQLSALLDAIRAPIDDRAARLATLPGKPSCVAQRHLAALALPADEAAARVLLRTVASLATSRHDPVEACRATAMLGQLDLARSGAAGRLAAAAWSMLQRGDRVVGAELAADAALGLAWSGHADRAVELATAAVAASIDRAPATGRRAMDARAAAALVLGRPVADGDVDARVRALAALLADEPADALDALVALEPDDPGFASVPRTQLVWLERTGPLLHRVLGEPNDAVADTWRWTPAVAAWDDLARAAELGGRGRVAAAQAAFTNADALLASTPIVRLLARRIAGELAVRDGWASSPVERALRAALAESVQRGFEALASRCRAVLRAGGFVVPRFSDGDDDVPVDLRATGVTARELEIVRLLQAGASTADVAAQLFVSVATVKSHVTHVMRKLGYRTRRELLAGIAVQT